MMINSRNHSEFTENMQRCHDYIKALEKERQKIQAFRRELPLCLELVTQAIDTCKQQLSGTTTATQCNLRGQSECSEQTSSDVPVFEEFIPIKRASSDSDGEDEEFQESNNDVSEKNCKKSDWLRSVQLWNQIPDPPSKDDSSRKFSDRNGGGDAFDYFKKERGAAGDGPAREEAAPPASTSSMAENGGGSKKEGRSPIKARRFWSPELHRRFLQVLQQLGGPHVATPKQIRELMKVDGLTNDEVKESFTEISVAYTTVKPLNSQQQCANTSIRGGGRIMDAIGIRFLGGDRWFPLQRNLRPDFCTATATVVLPGHLLYALHHGCLSRLLMF